MLKEGDKVPAGLLNTSFEGLVPGSKGETFSLAELTPKGKTLVLFFYPKDSTPGCTREAQGFTASRKAIEKAGGVVVGVSRDSVKSHGTFSAKFGLDVSLLSDPDKLLHEGFGAWGEKTMYGKKVLGAIRSTFFVKDGKVVKVWPSVKVDAHLEQVLAELGGKTEGGEGEDACEAGGEDACEGKGDGEGEEVSGADDVTVVWLEKSDAREDALHALNEWGHARGLKLTVAVDDPAQDAAADVDLASADRVEKELDRAREATAALDVDAAERALARADGVLRDHPELPQAAWLRAEVLRSWAARWSRVEPRDERRAETAWQDAEALDGGRAAGIGETAFPPRAKVSATIVVSGATHALVARLDGLALAGTADDTARAMTYAVEVTPGEHQLVLVIDGAVVRASWIAIATLPAGSPRQTLSFPVGEAGGCSAGSFASVQRQGATIHAANVECDQWIAAVPAPRPFTVLVARCHGDACGPFVEWRSEPSAASDKARDKPVPTAHAWPAWATWTAVGVGAVAAATITIIATGVLESRPVETRFVNGGTRTE